MTLIRAVRSWRVLVLVALAAALLVACADDAGTPAGEDRATEERPVGEAPAAATPEEGSAPAVVSSLPTGPVVTVDIGYEPPADHVPSTGAHLPANGKPTLVYVDAIW